MSTEIIFLSQLVLGYAAWLLWLGAYGIGRIRALERAEGYRAIAILHSFRFFGLVFILPGVVGPGLPASFSTFAAYGDFATGLLAMAALLAFKARPLFWMLVVAFNVVGVADLMVDYIHAIAAGLPATAGEMGAAYVIPILYVPLLMITHVIALYGLARPLFRPSAALSRSPNSVVTQV